MGYIKGGSKLWSYMHNMGVIMDTLVLKGVGVCVN
jgi:hypothetical protein